MAKHSLDFRDVVTIWRGNVIDPIEEREVNGERRRVAVGMMADGDFLVAVVYTIRGDIFRVISARRARRYERRDYADQFG